jgi:uncharacterized protein
MTGQMGERSTRWRHVVAMMLVFVPLSTTMPAVAGDVDDGLEAFKNGDYAVAHRLWLPLAEQGNMYLQHNLGVMYAYGNGVPRDDAAAVRWWRLAAEQGLLSSQYNLGNMYADGHGVPQNYVEAHRWTNIAASQGNEPARKIREAVADRMTREQIAEAQRLAREWRPAKTYAEALERIARDP